MKIRSGWALDLGVGAGILLLKVLAATFRFRKYGHEHFERFEAEGGGIVAFWHNRIIGGCVSPPFRAYAARYPSYVMISRHFDGELIARVSGSFGYKAVRGSSGKGGREAIDELAALVGGGDTCVITPDGPRGPRYVVQSGIARLCERIKRPVLPFYGAFSRRWKFDSWDGFEIPQPFAEISLLCGEMIRPCGDVETTRVRIEAAMRRQVAEGEALYGRPPDFVEKTA